MGMLGPAQAVTMSEVAAMPPEATRALGLILTLLGLVARSVGVDRPRIRGSIPVGPHHGQRLGRREALPPHGRPVKRRYR
jgi:hypothetical protein